MEVGVRAADALETAFELILESNNTVAREELLLQLLQHRVAEPNSSSIRTPLITGQSSLTDIRTDFLSATRSNEASLAEHSAPEARMCQRMTRETRVLS